MYIRPTSIIASSTVDWDLREFGHSLNQQLITDTDCVIPIRHKSQHSTIHRKDLSAGMSPWSWYHREWLTEIELDLDFVEQWVTWYRIYDEDTGVLSSYWYQWDRNELELQSSIIQEIWIQRTIELQWRYLLLQWSWILPEYICSSTITHAMSRLIGVMLMYGSIQSSGEVITSLKIDLLISALTRSQLDYVEQDCFLLAEQWLFVWLYRMGSGMREYIQLVCTDPEIHQIILKYLQLIETHLTMSTLDTLQSRSEQIISSLPQGYIVKLRQLS